MLYSVESVEPENNISLEGWTSCNVSGLVGFHDKVANVSHLVSRHSRMQRNSFMLRRSSKKKDRAPVGCPATGPFIRFNFKNDTTDSSYNTYGIMGSSSGDVPVQTFIDNLAPLGVETLLEWCTLCGNNNSRGCQFLQEENVNMGSQGLRWGGNMSPVGAGFLGAGLVVVVVGILAMVGVVLGVLRVGKRKPLHGRASSNASSGESGLVVCVYKHCDLTHVQATDLSLFGRMGPVERLEADNEDEDNKGLFVVL